MGQAHAEVKVEIVDDWDTIVLFSKQLGDVRSLCPSKFGITSAKDFILDCDHAKN